MIRGELCVSALCGAGDPPSPDKYVVIPWRSLLSALGGSQKSSADARRPEPYWFRSWEDFSLLEG